MSVIETAIDKLTVKPLLIAVGVLLLAVLVLSGTLVLQHYLHRVSVALADKTEAGLLHDIAAAQAKVAELSAANAGYGDTVATLQAALTHEQSQCATVRQQSAKALATAQAKAADADATLKTFTARYATAAAAADCAQALNQLEAACPALRSY